MFEFSLNYSVALGNILIFITSFVLLKLSKNNQLILLENMDKLVNNICKSREVWRQTEQLVGCCNYLVICDACLFVGSFGRYVEVRLEFIFVL